MANNRSLNKTDLSRLSAYELIDLLDEIYPPMNPRLRTPIDEVWYEAGQRNLVETLVALKERELNG